MNRQKSNLLLIFIFYIVCQVPIFNVSCNLAGFLDILNYTIHNGGLGTAKTPIPACNVMTIRALRQTNVSKQTTLLDGVDVRPPCVGIDLFMKL